MKALYGVVGMCALAFPGVRTDQYAVLRYDMQCLAFAKDAHLEVPLHDDGSPDFEHGKFVGISIDKGEKCGEYVVRKRK